MNSRFSQKRTHLQRCEAAALVTSHHVHEAERALIFHTPRHLAAIEAFTGPNSLALAQSSLGACYAQKQPLTTLINHAMGFDSRINREQKTKINLLQKDQQLNQEKLSLQQQKLKSESLIRYILIATTGTFVLIGIFIFRNINLNRKNEKQRPPKQIGAIYYGYKVFCE